MAFLSLGPWRFWRIEGNGADDPLAFLDQDELVGLDVAKGLYEAARPADFEDLDFFGFADSEVDAQIVLGTISAAAADFVDLRMKGFFTGHIRHAFQPSADAAAIGFRADGFDFEPTIAGV